MSITWTIGEMITDREKPKYSGRKLKNMLQCYFVHHKFRMKFCVVVLVVVVVVRVVVVVILAAAAAAAIIRFSSIIYS